MSSKHGQGKKNKAPSPEIQQQALAIAKGTQKPGQTKAQTKLIALGIQKGIEAYKTQHKAKQRASEKAKKKQQKQQQATPKAQSAKRKRGFPPALLSGYPGVCSF